SSITTRKAAPGASNSGLTRAPGTGLKWSLRRAGHHLSAIAADQLPPALMHQPVVAMTQQDQVVQVRRTAMDPVDHVMRDAPFRRSVAAGPLTVAVTNIERL